LIICTKENNNDFDEYNPATKAEKNVFKNIPVSKAGNNYFFNSVVIGSRTFNLFFHMVFTTFLRVWFVLYLYLKELI
jgi:hypothetical protein